MTKGYWDIHNHILPGVDDGSSCIEETYRMIRAEYKQGIRNIVFTPHFRPGMFDVKAADRERIYLRVCDKIMGIFPDMRFYLGCEYFVQKNTMTELEDARYRMNGTRIVLEEFSTVGHYETMRKAVGRTVKMGYRPILAHVERYQCLYKDPERIWQLKEKGALIQINAGNVLGKGGMSKKRFCHKLLAEGIVDFVASDAHNLDTRPVQLEACMQKIEKKYGSKTAEQLFLKNPERFLRN